MSLTDSFKKNMYAKVVSIALIALIFAPSVNVPSYAQVLQSTDCSAPLNTSIDQNYQGPVAIDGYWVDQGTNLSSGNGTLSAPNKKEVGPGEGDEVYAVILNNKGSQTIGSITGFLNLPPGFSPTGESEIPQLLQNYNYASKVAHNYALSSYYGNVGPGQSFILYFNVNVSPSATVGLHATTLVANYQIQENSGSVGAMALHCTSAMLEVPFVLPGKVVMDVSTDTPNILPARADPVSITITNKGSAPATGVIATITNLGQKGNSGSGSSGTLTLSSTTTNIVNLGANQFDLGNIPANGTSQIQTTVFPSTSAAGQTQDVSVMLTYENAWGKQISTQLDTGIVVAPIPPESLSLTYQGNTTSPIITANNLSTLTFAVTNNSTVPASNTVVSLVPQSTSVSVVGPSTWTIGLLEPGQEQTLSTQVFAATSLIDTPTAFTLTANYVANGQTQTNSLTLGSFVVGNIQLQIYGLSVSYVGNSPQITGSLLNQGSTTGLYGTIQLAPSPLLNAIKQARMAEANSSNYTSFQSASAQTEQNQGGGFSGGQGQGAGQGGGFGGGGQGRGGGGQGRGGGMAASQQFLGDLTADSPIPFSIPLYGLNQIQPGNYQVSFKVAYSDDLKNPHTVVLTQNVMVSRAQPTHVSSQGSMLDSVLGNPILLSGIGAAIIGGIAAAIIIRKRKSRKKLKMLTGSDTDIVTVLENSDKKQNESK